MTATRAQSGHGACDRCLRRCGLLAMLSAALEYRCRDRGRLADLMALDDEDLIRAVGGKRREELRARYASFDPAELVAPDGIETVCRHDDRFPPALGAPACAPHMLNVAGGTDRLSRLGSAPVVAVVGSALATDYGIEMAKSLAHGLAAAGVTVVSGLTDGISAAAHRGALEARGRTLAVMPGGLDAACPARWRWLFERVKTHGCAVAELPCGCATRRWGQAACERVVAALAVLTIVVEADESADEMSIARAALAIGRVVAAVPGRVTSPASSGTHALLIDGAPLVRGPGDALDLVFGEGATRRRPMARVAELDPTLKSTLESVGAGRDTPDKLAAGCEDAGEVLMALTELELMGLLARGDGGRFVPRDAHPAGARGCGT